MISVKSYLNRKSIQYKQRGDEAVSNCPFCDDKERKFAVNLITGAFLCLHANSCGKRGSFWDLQKLFGDEPEHLENGKAFYGKKQKAYKLPEVKPMPIKTPVMDYLKNVRKFTEETINHFLIGARDDRTAALPYMKNGVLVNVKYRDIIEKKKMSQEKDAEPCLFNRDRIYDELLVITEGEYDTMALYQYGIDAVSVPGGSDNFDWVETEWDYLETFKSVVLCLDGDKAGMDCAKAIINKLGAWRCKNVTLPYKDANDCLMNGISTEEIMACFHQAEDCKPAFLTLPSQHRQDVQDLFQFPDRLNGTPTPWDKLTAILKGWRDSEVTVWSGRSGAGKSTILNQVILHLASSNIKSCIASLEMPPKRYLRWAVIQHLENAHPHPSQIDRALTFFDDRIYIVDTIEQIEPGLLLEIFEYAARRYDVKHFVIDSLMRVKLPGKKELEEQKDFVSSLLSFSSKFSVHVHLVAHPRKGGDDNDKPGKVDVKGSGDITNLADNVLIMWRPDEEEKAAAIAKKKSISDQVLLVKKNREFGLEGGIKLSFNNETKRFTDGG